MNEFKRMNSVVTLEITCAENYTARKTILRIYSIFFDSRSIETIVVRRWAEPCIKIIEFYLLLR